MSIFVEAARVVASLAAMGQQFNGPTGPQVDFGSGEYLAGSVTSISADGLGPFATIGGKIALNKTAATRFWKTTTPASGANSPESGSFREFTTIKGHDEYRKTTATSLIALTLTVVEVLELTTGFGPPCEGDELAQGSRQFSALSGQLMVALPEDNWQGGAAQVYAEADTTLGTVAQRMAELDDQLAALIQGQADWVTHVRLSFGVLKDLLLVAYLIELAMRLAPPSGLIQSRAFAITVSALGLLNAVGMLATLHYFSIEHAQRAAALAGQYGQLAQEPVSGGARVQAKVATAAEESSVVSSFEGDSARMAMTSATSEASAAASVSDGSAAQRAALGGVRDAGEAAVVGAAAAAPAVSMPTLAEVSAWSGRAATLSGHASQHLNLVNQTMGSVQQITSMSQQSQPAPAPAAEETPTDEAPAEEAAPEQTTGDVDGAASGVGSETGERAPLEAVAVNIHQTPQPDPIGRSG